MRIVMLLYCFSLAVLAIIFCFLKFYGTEGFVRHDINGTGYRYKAFAVQPSIDYLKIFSMNSSSIPKKNHPMLLLYTKYYSSHTWWWLIQNETVCPQLDQIVEITHNKSHFLESDVVMFQGRRVPKLPVLEKLYETKPKKQIWIYYTKENPFKNPRVIELNRFFDATSTYRTLADIRIPYRFFRRNESPDLSKPNINYALNKTKQVGWVVSNCRAKERLELAHKLISYGIDLHVAGRCSKYFNKTFYVGNCTTYRIPCKGALEKFKFYFSAENALCEDYISEKYWITPFRNNNVPIVFGGSNYSNPAIAIPGSFIDAMSFPSPRALADYIKKVDADDELYNSFFEWKNYYTFDTDHYRCNLLKAINNGIKERNNSLINTIDIEHCNKQTKRFEEWINV